MIKTNFLSIQLIYIKVILRYNHTNNTPQAYRRSSPRGVTF
jgi:hypothetical protein